MSNEGARFKRIEGFSTSTWRKRRQGTSRSKWTPQIKVRHPVDVWGQPLDEFVKRLRDTADGLEDVEVDMEMEIGLYGDRDRDVFYVSGWRDATDEEYETARRELEERESQTKAWEERQIEQLRRARPELFK